MQIPCWLCLDSCAPAPPAPAADRAGLTNWSLAVPAPRPPKGEVSQASEKQEVGQPAESKTRAGLRACASARTRFRGTGRFRADTRCETPAWPNSPSLCLRGAAGALKIPPSTGFRSQTSLGRRTRRRRAGRMSLDFTTPRLPPRQVSCPQTTADDPARE
jgi:hypothetical protein